MLVRRLILGVLGCALALAISRPAVAQDWKWPTDRAIAVCWTNAVPAGNALRAKEQRKMQLVRQAVEANFSRFSDLSFSGWGTCGAGAADGIMIRIMWNSQRGDVNDGGRRNPAAFVGRRAITGNQRAWRYGGASPFTRFVNNAETTFRQGDTVPAMAGMAMQFDSSDDYVVSSGLHEFGHALGFSHDHVRRNGADFVCRALHPVVTEHQAGASGDENYLAPKNTSDSIMSYCPILKTTWNSISENDVLGLQQHYGDGDKGSIYRAGTKRGSPLCPSGSFLHLTSGECYSCPSGFQRSLNPDVRASNACVMPAQEQTSRATDRGTPTGFPIPTQCPGGAFLDVGKGRCYSCPSGYNRSAAPVTASNACSRRVGESHRGATKRGSVGCASGSFFDVSRGACYSCGPHHVRTAHAVDDAKACIRGDWGLSRQILKRQ
ncbi:MAG: hypothetical protein KTR31_08940 [Myxococcales bacterium]|nr:hypothetical protein [Myxococcales bacterium]